MRGPSFANWHFIEDGWGYGFVEALVGGVWQTVEVRDASGAVVSHPATDDPHGADTEGNGITGTSGGEYFVDEISVSNLPVGTITALDAGTQAVARPSYM